MVQLTDVISDFWQATQRGERSPLAWSGRLSNEEGYRVQLGIADHFQASGTNRVGWKVAATNKVVQAQLGVSEPAFGSLRDKDVLWSGGVLAIGNLAQAHVECELCFRVNEKSKPRARSQISALRWMWCIRRSSLSKSAFP